MRPANWKHLRDITDRKLRAARHSLIEETSDQKRCELYGRIDRLLAERARLDPPAPLPIDWEALRLPGEHQRAA